MERAHSKRPERGSRGEQTPAEILLIAKVPLPLLIPATSDDMVSLGVNGLPALHGAKTTSAIPQDERDA